MRKCAAILLAAIAVAGCVGPARHHRATERWLPAGTGRASVALRAATPSEVRPFRVAVYGDCRGNREAHRSVVAAMRAAHPDLVLFTGDAIQCFPVGDMPDFGAVGYLVPFWPQVHRGYPLFSLLTLLPFPAAMHEVVFSPFYPVRDRDGFEGFLSDTAPLRVEDRVPYLFAPGNHDLYHRFDREEVARLFGAPGAEGGHDARRLWFSEDIGAWRLVVLDSGTDLFGDGAPLAQDSPQVRWLEATLAEADAAGRASIVALHLPPFSSGAEDPTDPALRTVLVEGVLDRHHVPLVLNGHCHGYERIERARPDGGRMTFLVTGGAGAPFHHEAPPAARAEGSRVFVEETLHFVLLEVGARSIRGRVVSVPEGKTLDDFEVPAQR